MALDNGTLSGITLSINGNVSKDITASTKLEERELYLAKKGSYYYLYAGTGNGNSLISSNYSDETGSINIPGIVSLGKTTNTIGNFTISSTGLSGGTIKNSTISGSTFSGGVINIPFANDNTTSYIKVGRFVTERGKNFGNQTEFNKVKNLNPVVGQVFFLIGD